MRATPYTDEELTRLTMGREVMGHPSPNDGESQLAQEVLYQRRWMAYAARVIESQTLDMPKLAKCRRRSLTWMRDTLRALARGEQVVTNRRQLESEYADVLRDSVTAIPNDYEQ